MAYNSQFTGAQIDAAIAVGAAVTSVIFRALAQRGKREANSPKDAA